MTDLLDTVTDTPLTQDDYDRALKLDAGIKTLQAELDALKERIRTEHPNTGTFVHGKVIVKRGVQNRVDAAATEKNLPAESFPDFWETRPVFDLSKAKKEAPATLIVTKAIETVSIQFGQ